MARGRLVRRPPAPARTGFGAFAPDANASLEAWGGSGFVVLVEVGTGELVRLEDPHKNVCVGWTFSPDGTLLIGFSNESHRVRAWDLRTIRRGLVELGLDWDAPPYPPEKPTDPGAAPLEIRVVAPRPSGK